MITIGVWGYVLVVALGVASAALVQLFARSLGVKLMWAQVRMTLQLVLMGFVLVALFAHPHPALSLGAVAVMEIFAVATVRSEHRRTVPTKALRAASAGLVCGSAVSAAIFLCGVVGVNPLVNPRYLLPILGMIIGNSMTAMNLAVRAMHTQVESQRTRIVTALLLGATKTQATAPLAREAFTAALTPTLTTMFSLGIVMLPGMMTGQILSGTVPLVAVGYQLAIMVGILFAVVVSTWLALSWGGRHYISDIPD